MRRGEDHRRERYRVSIARRRLGYGGVGSTEKRKDSVVGKEGRNRGRVRNRRVRLTRRGGRRVRRNGRGRDERKDVERGKTSRRRKGRGGREGRRRRGRSGTRRAQSTKGERKIEAFEYPIRIRRATIGRRVRREANDRRVRYRGLERSSLSMYVLAGRRRGSAYSTEAGLKYYVVGALGSGRRLYGRTWRYRERGTRNRVERKRRRVDTDRSDVGVEKRGGRRRVMGARRFKVSAVPRHRWTADVYEGAPSGSGRYFAVVPKRAIRVGRTRRGGRVRKREGGEKRGRRLGRVSGRTRRVGAVGGLRQRRWKRRRAYSAIGNGGHMRRGVRVGTREGRSGRRRYGRVYMGTTRGRWKRRRTVKRKGKEGQRKDRKYRTERKGLGRENGRRGGRRRRRRMSMAGIPPRAGFGAKRGVYRGLVQEGYRKRARVGVRGSAVGARNYIRMVKRSQFEGKGEKREVERTKEATRRRGRVRRRRRRRRRNPKGVRRFVHRMGRERRR
jgi:NADH:ubiquinone oxidoreductase subunit 2 (subunit N)